ncbi:YdcF family protein [Alteromonas sp. 009811495]|uniref:YdcF family protein n=1 Tax=Alteromonas sp. 009811495 TaxID=3002962 RepID=UPI00237DD4A1|nr:YdcF family protein [Alteromonas sp. 009811495]WDT85007.1 YdcF family protein [Alteromonas sp. 009811495]
MELLKLIVVELVSPLKFSFLLMLLALLLKIMKRERGCYCVSIFAVAWLLLWSQPYASKLLLSKVEYQLPTHDDTSLDSPDYIFVLACYYNTEGALPEISRWQECSLQRNVEAARLHFLTKAPIIISGGYFLDDEKVNFSDKAADFFQSLNINASELILTRQGTNTHEEIVSVKPYITDKNIWVVSSASHIARIKLELGSTANSVTYFPVDYHHNGDTTFFITWPSEDSLQNARRGLYELLARVKYKLLN